MVFEKVRALLDKPFECNAAVEDKLLGASGVESISSVRLAIAN